MGSWIGLLFAAFLYCVWLAWFDTRHHHPIIATTAALLAAVYLALTTVAVADQWVNLPLWPTIVAFVMVEAIVRTLHRFSFDRVSAPRAVTGRESVV